MHNVFYCHYRQQFFFIYLGYGREQVWCSEKCEDTPICLKKEKKEKERKNGLARELLWCSEKCRMQRFRLDRGLGRGLG